MILKKYQKEMSLLSGKKTLKIKLKEIIYEG
jgi:hypothetical protein